MTTDLRCLQVALDVSRGQTHLKEFRDDVVAIARQDETPINQIAKDFGLSESCLRNRLHQADVEHGANPA